MALNSYVLKVLVEKQTNRVALAESGADFVLLLFRLFTLPLSTIVKLVGKQAPMACLNLLYESVETLKAEQFNTEACKAMLLRPKCISRAAAGDLKVNIEEGNSATTFYVCEKPTCSIEGYKVISTIMGAICGCGGVMNTLIKSKISKDGGTDLKELEKVFTNEACRFMISDDLKVRAISTLDGFSFLDDLGIGDAKHLEERTVKIGTDQVVRLVKRVMLSKTPLTDVIFPDEVDKDDSNNFQHHVSTVFEKAEYNNLNKIPLKLVISKSSGRVLYAEASEKFVDILFSFLTFPLGSALHFLDGNSSMGCVDNLYKSMGNMRDNWLLTDHGGKLLKPNLPPHFSCLNQPLTLKEDSYCQYYVMDCMDSKCWGPTHQVISDNVMLTCSHGHGVSKLPLNVRDPTYRPSSPWETKFGFVKGPATFMITDELEVSPLSFFSALSFLSRFNLKRGDVEERIVQVGTPEVISLLRASITSNQVLNHAFNVRKEDEMVSQ